MAKSQMQPSIAFDTTPLIWGVREDSDPNDSHMIAHTKKYIKKLQSEGYGIVIPSPVVSEYLVGATATQFHEAKILSRGFLIADLDSPSAVLAARLQRGGMVDIIHNETGIPKPSIRIDTFIIAIAILNRVEKIITHNKNEFETIAKGMICIEDVPIIQEQTTMEFDSPDEEE